AVRARRGAIEPVPRLGTRGLAHDADLHGTRVSGERVVLPGARAGLRYRHDRIGHPADAGARRHAAVAVPAFASEAARPVAGDRDPGRAGGRSDLPGALDAAEDGDDGATRRPLGAGVLMERAVLAQPAPSPIRGPARRSLDALSGGFWLGWKIESNWTDAFRFLTYQIARPDGGALLLVFMYFAVA